MPTTTKPPESKTPALVAPGRIDFGKAADIANIPIFFPHRNANPRIPTRNVAMTHQSERGSGRIPDPAALDREADRLLAEGQHLIAERLSHLAAGLRTSAGRVAA